MHRVLPWILPGGLAALWFLAGHFNWLPAYLLPRPSEVMDTALVYILGTPGDGPYAGRFSGDALASLGRVGLGFLLAVALGIPLGLWSGRVDTVRRLLGTSVNGLRAVPGITWLPLAMVWFGIGLKTTVFLVALAAFFPVYLNAAAGASQVSPVLLRAGAMMGLGRLRGTFDILLPAAMPAIAAGLRLGLGISWAYLVLGELSGVPDGLGAVIMDARMLGRIDMIVAGILIIAVMGRLSDLLLKQGLKTCFKSAAGIK
ncbi:MAG: ABC transporter permease [Desulfobacter sp.]